MRDRPVLEDRDVGRIAAEVDEADTKLAVLVAKDRLAGAERRQDELVDLDPSAPASNEKIFTAMGALAVLGADARLTTEVRLTAGGDLVVVGGGDATLTAGADPIWTSSR